MYIQAKKMNLRLQTSYVTCHISIIVHVAFNNVACMHAADRTSQKQNIACDYSTLYRVQTATVYTHLHYSFQVLNTF